MDSARKMTHLIRNPWMQHVQHLYFTVVSHKSGGGGVKTSKEELLKRIWLTSCDCFFFLSTEEMKSWTHKSNDVLYEKRQWRKGVFVVSYCPLQDVWGIASRITARYHNIDMLVNIKIRFNHPFFQMDLIDTSEGNYCFVPLTLLSVNSFIDWHYPPDEEQIMSVQVVF